MNRKEHFCSNNSVSTSFPRPHHGDLSRGFWRTTGRQPNNRHPGRRQQMDGIGKRSCDPAATLEAIKHGFGIDTIGSMQASIRTEEDLEDFLHAILFQEGGPLLHVTGTEGWERKLVQDRFRITRWGAAMTRLWEDCHYAVKASRTAALSTGTNANAASFGQAIGQAIEVNLTARGEEPPVPRIDPKKRRELLMEFQQTWPGLLLREVNIPGPRCMDQLWNDRRPGKELKY